MNNLSRTSESRGVQKQHIRHYDSGKIRLINKGITKSLSANPIKVKVRQSNIKSTEQPSIKLSPRPKKEIYKRLEVWIKWDQAKMLAAIERRLKYYTPENYPSMQILLSRSNEEWEIFIGLGWATGVFSPEPTLMAKIHIKSNDASTALEMLKEQYLDLMQLTQGQAVPFLSIEYEKESYHKKTTKEDTVRLLRQFIAESGNISIDLPKIWLSQARTKSPKEGGVVGLHFDLNDLFPDRPIRVILNLKEA